MNIEEMLQIRDGHGAAVADGLAGTWTNSLGSCMELTLDESGALHGTYTSGVRDKHTYPLHGFANATTVSFTVNFTSSASIGAWAGHFDPEAGTLDMLWHLVAEPKADEVWDTTFAGFDTFRRAT
jgi:hypothetical protein